MVNISFFSNILQTPTQYSRCRLGNPMKIFIKVDELRIQSTSVYNAIRRGQAYSLYWNDYGNFLCM